VDVRVKEAVLRRWAERAEVPQVSFEGVRVAVSLEVRVEGAEARVEATGRREFGGWVRFDAPDPAREPSGMPRFIAKSARRMIEAFAALCLCARPRDCCDCCLVCEGTGRLPGDSRAEACEACGGLGYEG
jgi:hypothetical protein